MSGLKRKETVTHPSLLCMKRCSEQQYGTTHNKQHPRVLPAPQFLILTQQVIPPPYPDPTLHPPPNPPWHKPSTSQSTQSNTSSPPPIDPDTTSYPDPQPTGSNPSSSPDPPRSHTSSSPHPPSCKICRPYSLGDFGGNLVRSYKSKCNHKNSFSKGIICFYGYNVK